MLEMVRGCRVPHPERLSEQYERNEHGFAASLNAPKLPEAVRRFIAMQEEQLFFFLELPANEKTEERLRREGDTAALHTDVYYADWLDAGRAGEIMARYGELLIHDGISSFGFGVKSGAAEIMLDKYNVVILWTGDPERYEDFFPELGIPRVPRCQTAWDTFTREEPGECRRIEIGGKSVFDLPEELAGIGLYFAERREE